MIGYVNTDDLCGTCKVHSVTLIPPRSAVEVNDLCPGCYTVCEPQASTNQVVRGGWADTAVRVKSPYWKAMQPALPNPPPTMANFSGHIFMHPGNLITRTVNESVSKGTLTPVVDLNSECPCGGGLLRKQCKWHGGGPECH